MTDPVFAVDPGVKTGWAIWNGLLVQATGESDQLPFCDVADMIVREHGPLTIVCEAYHITQETMRKTRQSASLEIIGVLRWIAHREGCEFVLQNASAAKRFMTDRRLLALAWKRPGTLGHANDALRHLGLYLAKNGHEEILRAT